MANLGTFLYLREFTNGNIIFDRFTNVFHFCLGTIVGIRLVMSSWLATSFVNLMTLPSTTSSWMRLNIVGLISKDCGNFGMEILMSLRMITLDSGRKNVPPLGNSLESTLCNKKWSPSLTNFTPFKLSSLAIVNFLLNVKLFYGR